MSQLLEEIKATVATLPRDERADLVDYLLDSLEPDPSSVSEAWRDEVTRRMSELKNGDVEGVPVEDVLARLRERYP